jgi:hypothetical protein
MGEDLTAASFDGRELRGSGPGGFVYESRPDVVAGHGLGELARMPDGDAPA